jgi:hypothetical protein
MSQWGCGKVLEQCSGLRICPQGDASEGLEEEKIRRTAGWGLAGSAERPHFSQRTREMGHPALKRCATQRRARFNAGTGYAALEGPLFHGTPDGL